MRPERPGPGLPTRMVGIVSLYDQLSPNTRTRVPAGHRRVASAVALAAAPARYHEGPPDPGSLERRPPVDAAHPHATLHSDSCRPAQSPQGRPAAHQQSDHTPLSTGQALTSTVAYQARLHTRQYEYYTTLSHPPRRTYDARLAAARIQIHIMLMIMLYTTSPSQHIYIFLSKHGISRPLHAPAPSSHTPCSPCRQPPSHLVEQLTHATCVLAPFIAPTSP